MRMEDANVRVYRFDERDIIATSSGIIPSGTSFIVLSDESVQNFNNMHKDGDPKLATDYYSDALRKRVQLTEDDFAYNRFGGKDDSYDSPWKEFIITDVTNNAEAFNITVVHSGNEKEYEAVLDWLKTHTDYPN